MNGPRGKTLDLEPWTHDSGSVSQDLDQKVRVKNLSPGPKICDQGLSFIFDTSDISCTKDFCHIERLQIYIDIDFNISKQKVCEKAQFW